MINKELNKKCGDRLKECLKEKNITQNELAEVTDYTPQYISNIVTGLKPLSLKAAHLFSEVLSVRPEYLLAKDNDKTIQERNRKLGKFTTDISFATAFVLGANGIYISQEIVTYKNGEIVYLKPGDPFFLNFSFVKNISVPTDDGTILKIEYDIKFDSKTYRVDYTEIRDIIVFMWEYLSVKKEILYKKCIEKNAYKEIEK